MDAFSILDRSRPWGMGGPMGIPFSEIDAFARRYGFEDLSAFERFLRLISAMDDAFLAHYAKTNKPKDTQSR